MREIKFRAWSIKGKTMWYISKQMSLSIEGDSWQIRDNIIGCRFMSSWHENEKGILMQYTGLKDKNGKEIYEGDITKRTVKSCNNCKNMERIGLIEYRTGSIVLDENYKNGESCPHEYFGLMLPILEAQDEWLEIIGNIYENPELLEK
jgi:uncharacterized phage protein (TIGR01671 family)